MNWLDYALAAILIAATVGGFRKGFTRTVIGMATLFAAVLGATWMYGTGASFFMEYVSHRSIAGMLGFCVVFMLIVALGSLVGWVAERTMKAAGLGWLDRILGAGAGFVQAVLVAIAFVLVLTAFSRNPPPQAVVESEIAPYIIEASNVLAEVAPRELRDGFDDGYAKVKESWKGMMGKGVSKLPGNAF